MKRSRNKLIVLIMLLAMIAGTLGAAVPLVQSTAQNQAPVERVREVVALRETNSETYLLSNGSYECVVYAGDKYYRDSRNSLKLIDNTLILDEATAKTEKRHYKNTANSFQVTFSDSDTPSVTMAKDDFAITFRAESASGGNPFQTASTQKAVTVGAVRNCDTLTDLTDTGSDTITYTNAFYNTDLVYVLQNNALKEYIVLKNADAPNAITFRFSTEGLTLTELDGIGVFLDESKNEVFRLDRLFALDSNGDMTEELSYTFASVKGSRDILVTVTLDAEYLAAEDRAFPVVIDPSVMISSAQTADASVYSGYPDTNYQMEKRLRTGKDTTYGKRRAYLRFNLPSNIPANKVTEATLDLKKHSGVAPAVRAYRCESEWASGTITWNNMPSYTVENLSSSSVQRSSGSAWYEMDVTETVKKWMDRSWANYGFVVRDNVESNTDRWTTFYSSDAPSPNKPELHITYSAGNDTPITPGEETEPDIPEPSIPDEPEDPIPSVTLDLQHDYKYGANYSDADDRIEAQATAISNFFWENYGLEVYLTTASRSTSYADAHENEIDVSDPFCGNSDYGDLKSNHFKNIYNILFHMTTPNQYTVKMLYVGHNICFVDSSGYGHQFNSSSEVPIRGLSLDLIRSMVITDTRDEECETITAIHEFGHMFGVKDHYDKRESITSNKKDYCIYGYDKELITLVDEIVICPGCDTQLRENLYDYTPDSN